MLRPIPARILRSTATVEWCYGTDVYQNQLYQSETVEHVHVQPTSAIVKTLNNTECQLRSVMFVDAKLSSPALDWEQMLADAHRNGGDVRVTVRGIVYTLTTVDALRDDTDTLHHWELGLV